MVVLGGDGDESTEALWIDLLQFDALQQNKLARYIVCVLSTVSPPSLCISCTDTQTHTHTHTHTHTYTHTHTFTLAHTRTAPLLYGVMQLDTADSDETQKVGLWLLKGGATMADGLLHVCLCPKKLRNAGIILHINLANV